MGKRKIPGIGKSKGMQSEFILFPAGKYLFEVVSHKEVESRSGLGINHYFRFKCLDTFTDGCEALIGKTYFHRMYEMLPDASSYEEYGHIFVDESKSLFDATGYVIKADMVDYDELVGKTFVATVAQKDGQDAEGNEKKENVITKYEAEK